MSTFNVSLVLFDNDSFRLGNVSITASQNVFKVNLETRRSNS